MKPLQLMPKAVTVKETAPSSNASIGLIVLGGVLVMGIAGFFGWATVSDLSDQTASLTSEAQALTNQEMDIRAQIAEANTRSDYKPTAQTVQTELVSKLNERVDYALVSRELAAVMPPGSWLTSLSSSVPETGAEDVDNVTIQGYVSKVTDVAALVTNLNATETLSEAHVSEVAEVTSADDRTFFTFTIMARFVTEAQANGAPFDPTAVTVSNGPEGAGELALEPEPGYYAKKEAAAKKQAAAKAKNQPKPLSSLEKVANSAAGWEDDA